jgi:ribosomal protein L19
MVELVALPSGSGSDVVAMAIAEEIVLKKCGAHEGVEVHAVATFSKFVNDVEVVRDHPLIDRLIDRKERP